jgi:hypothetical protein
MSAEKNWQFELEEYIKQLLLRPFQPDLQLT